jgi:hypothetical protein
MVMVIIGSTDVTPEEFVTWARSLNNVSIRKYATCKVMAKVMDSWSSTMASEECLMKE